MSSDPVLKVQNLRTQFFTSHGVVHAVDGISFDVSSGEVFGLVGESGSGKSVTALSILRLIPPPGRITSGEVRLKNVNLLDLSPAEMRKVRGNHMSLVFQSPTAALNPILTIGWQFKETLQAHLRIPNVVARQKAIETLRSVGIPDPERRYSSYPHEFSGGMNQRSVIGMGVVNKPKLLIADEPTTALDVTIQAQILELLKSLTRKDGMALLLITHNMGVIANMCDRVAVMYAGEIVEQARVHDLFRKPLHPYTWMLLRSIPRLNHNSDRFPTISGTHPDMIDLPIGCRFRIRCPFAEGICAEHPPLEEIGSDHLARCWLSKRSELFITRLPKADSQYSHQANLKLSKSDLRLRFPAVTFSSSPQKAPLLDLRNVVKKFLVRDSLFGKQRPVHAVDGVNLQVRLGETLGIVGESGSGKSTLAGLIVGLYPPTVGEVLVDGQNLASNTPEANRRRRQLQIIFQDPLASLNPRLRIGDSILEPLEAQGYVGHSESNSKMQEILGQVGLRPELANRYPHELSGGQQQRVCIARAVMANPRLIVADEAVGSLDVSLQAQVLNLLQDLQDQLGYAYIFISHDLAVVQSVSTTIGVMYLGKIVELAPAEKFSTEPLHPYSVALRSAIPILEPEIERKRKRIILQGDIPSPLSPPLGCRFHTRCPLTKAICMENEPKLIQYQTGHWAACHFAGTFDKALQPLE